MQTFREFVDQLNAHVPITENGKVVRKPKANKYIEETEKEAEDESTN